MTILYEEDWGRYPSAAVHYETRNRSWVELAKKLEMVGVKNNKFFLALLNPALRYVDPWDENLPDTDAVSARARGCHGVLRHPALV